METASFFFTAASISTDGETNQMVNGNLNKPFQTSASWMLEQNLASYHRYLTSRSDELDKHLFLGYQHTSFDN